MQKDVDNRYVFEDMPVHRAILRLAAPAVIGQIIEVIYNMADTFFVGLSGSDAKITAVTVCMPAFMFITAISNLFGVGGASVISRAMGAKDPETAKGASAFSFWGSVLIMTLYCLGVFLFRDPFIDLLGGKDPVIHKEAITYLTYTVIIGGISEGMNALLAHLLRSQGKALQSSFGIAGGGILNIILDPLFMFVFLPEGQEILGVALATMLSNFASTIYFIFVLKRMGKSTVLRFNPTKRAVQNHVPRDVLLTGLPACVMTMFENISYAVLDNRMMQYGTAVQAGVGVAKKINMLAHSVVRGMTQGVLPLIGYSYGARKIHRMKDTVMDTAIISVCIAAGCTLVNLLWADGLVGIFIQHASVSAGYASTFLNILSIGCPFSACAYTFISFFQAVGKSGRSFVLAILRKGLLDIPLMFLLDKVWPVNGITAATPIADVICCVTALALSFSFIRGEINLENEEDLRQREEDRKLEENRRKRLELM